MRKRLAGTTISQMVDLTPISKPWFTWAMLACLLVGAVLRITYAIDRPFTGDEAGTLEAIRLSYHDLLTQFGGWRTMNFYLAGLKGLSSLLGDSPAVLIAPSLIAGILLIVLADRVGRKLRSPLLGVTAAWLVALNPFLIRFSAVIRSYSLLAAFCTAGLLAWLHWRERPSWRNGCLCALLLACALLIHLNATYYIAALACLSGLTLLEWRKSEPARLLLAMTLLVPCMVAMGLVLLAYVPQLADISAFRRQWSAASPTSVGYLSQVYGMYLGDRWTVPITFALLAAGTWTIIRTGHLQRTGILLIIVLYIAMMSLAGVSHYAAAFARFSIALLPLMLIVIAEGVLAFRKPLAIAAFIAVTVATQGEVRSLFSAKASAPWNKVAGYVLQQPNIDSVVPLGGSVVAAMNCNSPRPIAFSLPSQLPSLGASPLRVLVVDEQSVLQPRGKCESFGAIRVIEYTGQSARQVAEQILSDLDQALGGKPNGQRNSYDLAGFELALALGHPDAYTLWRERYWSSYARSPAARNAPSHMTDWPRYR